MAGEGEKALRGLEAGSRIGYLALAGAAVYLVYSFFKGKGNVVTKILTSNPPVDPGVPAPPPATGADDTGVTTGGLTTGVHARIVNPAQGNRVYRNTFSSYYDATIEVTNENDSARAAQIEVVADYYELTGGQRLGVRTLVGTFNLGPGEVRQIQTTIDSGNTNTVVYELGQANAVVQVNTNSHLTQSTSYEVW